MRRQAIAGENATDGELFRCIARNFTKMTEVKFSRGQVTTNVRMDEGRSAQFGFWIHIRHKRSHGRQQRVVVGGKWSKNRKEREQEG
jgi:hypothetical protein